MPLLALPNELLIIITSKFTPSELNNLLSTNRRLYHVLTPQLHVLATEPKSGLPALHWAVLRNYIPLAELLLSQATTATINEKCKGSWTALHYASVEGRVEMVRLLLSKGADTSVKNYIAETALEVTAEFGAERRFGLLLQFPAYRIVDDKFPVSRWHQWAGVEAYETIAKLLVEYGSCLNDVDVFGRTPLHWAAGIGAVGIMRILLQSGAAPNLQTRDGDTPLMWAISGVGSSKTEPEARLEMIEMLLEHGADGGLHNATSQKPLHQAVREGLGKAAKLLLKSCVDVNAADVHGWTVLHHAVRNKDWFQLGAEGDEVSDGYACIRMFIEHGADVQLADIQGNTVLHLAVEMSNEKLVKMFVEKGVDPFARNIDGMTAFEYVTKIEDQTLRCRLLSLLRGEA